MTNQNQNVETTSASVAPKPEIMPRLVPLFVAPMIGVVVAFSLGRAVNIYGYHTEQSAIKPEENQEQFGKTGGGKFSQTSRREELPYSLTGNLEGGALKMIKNLKPEFYYRSTFTDKKLTESHFYTESLLPTEDGKCGRILLGGNPISPVEDTLNTDPAEEIVINRENREPVARCNYPIDFDDYFAQKTTKPEKQKDWTGR